MLVNEQQLFTSGVSGLCRESDFSGKDLKLRLDTKLYCYLHEDNMIGLWETYAVNGITVTNKIGSWNESFGLSVPPPNMVNIWHRRTSLHGLTVNVASINRTRPCPLNLGFILWSQKCTDLTGTLVDFWPKVVVKSPPNSIKICPQTMWKCVSDATYEGKIQKPQIKRTWSEQEIFARNLLLWESHGI